MRDRANLDNWGAGIMAIEFPATTEEIIKELRDILKTYHYESEDQQMSKDVATSLENLLGAVKGDLYK